MTIYEREVRLDHLADFMAPTIRVLASIIESYSVPKLFLDIEHYIQFSPENGHCRLSCVHVPANQAVVPCLVAPKVLSLNELLFPHFPVVSSTFAHVVVARQTLSEKSVSQSFLNMERFLFFLAVSVIFTSMVRCKYMMPLSLMSSAYASSSHCYLFTLARPFRAGVQLSRLMSGGKIVHNGHLDQIDQGLSCEIHAYTRNLFQNINILSLHVVKARRVNKMHHISGFVHESILFDIRDTLNQS